MKKLKDFEVSLQTRITFIVLLGMMPLVILTVDFIYMLHGILTERAHKDVFHSIQMIAAEQDNIIFGTRELMATMAHWEIVDYENNSCDMEMLSGLQKHNPAYSIVSITKANGSVICSTQPTNDSINLFDREYFRRAIENRTFSVSGYLHGRVSNAPILAMAQPVIDEYGNVKTVIVVELDTNWISKKAGETDLPPDSTLMIIDHDGNVISRLSKTGHTAGEVIPEVAETLQLADKPDNHAFEEIGQDRTRQITTIVPLGNTGNYILAHVPSIDVQAKTTQVISIYIGGLIAALFLVHALSNLLGKKLILNTVDRMEKGIHRVMEGDLNVQVAVENDSSELGRLSRTFDDMVKKLIETREAIQESESRYRIVFETANEGIWRLDKEFRIFDVNQKAAEILGYSVDELTGKSIYDFVSEEDFPILKASFQDRLNGQSDTFERKYIKKDGSRCWVLVSATPIYDHHGEFAGSFSMLSDITHRKRAEDALRKNQLYLYSMLSNLPVGVVLKTPDDGRYLIINPAAEQIYGIKAEELIGKTDEAVFEDQYIEYRDKSEEAFRSHLPINLIEKIGNRSKLGQRTIQTTLVPIFDDEDNPLFLMVVSDDISMRIRADEILKRQLKEMAVLHEISTLGIQTTSLDELLTKTTSVVGKSLFPDSLALFVKDEENESLHAHTSFHGLEVAEFNTVIPLGKGIIGKTAIDGICRRIADTENEPEYIAYGPAMRSELCVPIKTNNQVFGIMNAESSIPGAFTGDDERLLKTLADQLAVAVVRLRLEEELKERLKELFINRQSLETILQNLPVSITVKDMEGKYILWNRASEEIFGYSFAEVKGKTDEDLFSPEYTKELLNTDKEAIQRRSPVAIPIQEIETVHGEKRHLYSIRVPLWNEDGNPRSILTLTQDISHQILSEQELWKAKEAAEAAVRAKSEFLANMSHEIRTPMNSVIGMTSLLLDTELSDEQQEFVETIRQGGDTLLSIINDILDFSKIEAGKMDIEEQPFSLHECIESVMDLLAPQAAVKHLDMAYQIADDTPSYVQGDVTRLRQILVNLIGNAIKFTEEGEVVLSVRLKESCSDQKNGILEFIVRDTGIGIPGGQMEKLFQSFSQLDTSTTRKFGGSGLGLVICRRLVDFMNGEIRAESEGIPGKGSSFIFTIQVGLDVQPLGVEPKCGLSKMLAHKRMLVVDDNATNRRIIEKQGQNWGIQVSLANSGPAALEILKNDTHFDMAILDVHMPDMDGFMLAERIREQFSPQQLPIIFLTSLGYRQKFSEAIKPAAFLYKPIKLSLLCENLVSALFPVKNSDADNLEEECEKNLGKENTAVYPLHILLAEDNPINQRVAIRLLEKIGFRPDTVGNGNEALQAILRQKYDVILMDIQMPELDGVETTRQIRSRFPADRQPYIIAMTANALDGDRESYLNAGMNDYISKPVTALQLKNALQKAISRMKISELEVTKENMTIIQNEKAPTNSSIDISYICQSLPDGDIDLLIEIVALFKQEISQQMRCMHEAVCQKNNEQLRITAHTIKGSALTVGANRLVELCKQLELLGREGKVEDAGQTIISLEAEIRRVVDDLERYATKMAGN